MGHPCCSERDCKVPLDKVTDKYCPIHRNLGSVCCVTGCQNPKGSGFLTCKLGSHRKEERRRTENKGRRRRTSGRGVQAEEDIGEGDDAEEERNGVRARHNNGARSVVKGIFSRRWTHNEQLMVRPCGIIIGRATFFSAESMTGVKVRGWIIDADTYMLTSDGIAFHTKHIPARVSRHRTHLHIFRQRMRFENAYQSLCRSFHPSEGCPGCGRLPFRKS